MAPSSWIVTQLHRENRCVRADRFVPRILALLAAAAFLFLLAVPALAQSRAPRDEEEILRLLNQERQTRGLPALALSEPLQQAARKHSERMADARQISHQFPGEHSLSRRLGHETQHFDVSGENVAMAASAARAHAALMHSPGHRANILDEDYNSVGIGVVRSGEEIYVTQDFARVVENSSVQQIENRVAAELIRERRSAGLSGVHRIEVPDLRSEACEMASHNKLNPRASLATTASYQPSGSVAFTALDPDQVAGSLRGVARRPARAFAVGACYQSSASYDNPVYWIIVVSYR